jgi:hypothetical protein
MIAAGDNVRNAASVETVAGAIAAYGEGVRNDAFIRD